jgi:hypothetical protein
MQGEQEDAPQAKYVYKYRFEPVAPPKAESGEIDKKELQNYINGLLGMPTSKRTDERIQAV